MDIFERGLESVVYVAYEYSQLTLIVSKWGISALKVSQKALRLLIYKIPLPNKIRSFPQRLYL